MTSEKERTIISRRTFAAAREAVWESFRNPAALAAWWGPAGFTNTFHAFGFRPGGAWDFTMRASDGTEYRMQKIFIEIEAPTRIVLDHPDATHGFRMFILLNERDGATEVNWTMRFDTAEEAARVRAIVEASNEQNFDRLANYLSTART